MEKTLLRKNICSRCLDSYVGSDRVSGVPEPGTPESRSKSAFADYKDHHAVHYRPTIICAKIGEITQKTDAGQGLLPCEKPEKFPKYTILHMYK